MGCAIFGITEVPTDGVDFASDFGYTNADTPAQPMAAPYAPPPPNTTSAEPITLDQPATSAATITDPKSAKASQTAVNHAKTVIPPPQEATVDLLGDNKQERTPQANQGEINELD